MNYETLWKRSADAVAIYLRQNGYDVLDRDDEEFDIVAREKNGTFAFVDVRVRVLPVREHMGEVDFNPPVGEEKRMRKTKAAADWLDGYFPELARPRDVRFDDVLVTVGFDGGRHAHLRHSKGYMGPRVAA